MSFDPTKLGELTEGSTSGGGYTNIRFIPKEDCEIIPNPVSGDEGIIVDDFVLKAGKNWLNLFVDNDKVKLDEEGGDVKYSNFTTANLELFIPGDSEYIRSAVNSKLFTKEGYVLIDNCEDMNTILVGKQACNPGTFKVTYASGMKGEEKGWTLVFTAKQQGVSCVYKGVGSANERVSVPINATTLDVTKGTATYLLPENTGATAITTITNATAGDLITLEWKSTVNHSTFDLTVLTPEFLQLNGAFTPAEGAVLVLQATDATHFAERYRYLP